MTNSKVANNGGAGHTRSLNALVVYDANFGSKLLCHDQAVGPISDHRFAGVHTVTLNFDQIPVPQAQFYWLKHGLFLLHQGNKRVPGSILSDAIQGNGKTIFMLLRDDPHFDKLSGSQTTPRGSGRAHEAGSVFWVYLSTDVIQASINRIGRVDRQQFGGLARLEARK